jgi:hypothetical protein
MPTKNSATSATPGRYWAFISYSSKDRKPGEWLQRRLESYPIPRDLRGTELFDGEILGKYLRPVFRDRDELSGSAHLGPAILAALEKSRFLIVLCSPNSAKSAWVNKEILDFMALRPENPERILALILDGASNASSDPAVDDSLECFPPALRYPAEPLAGDLRSEGDGRERGFLKILSGIIQLDFDKLYGRHERYMKRRRAILGSIAGVLLVILSGLTAFALLQRKEAIKQATLAIEQRATTQKTMATGFLRSIGQSRGITISGAEQAALQELAAVSVADVAVREEFIRRLFEEPESCRRLIARSGLVVHAAVGFNAELTEILAGSARDVLSDKESGQMQRDAALLTLARLASEPGELSLVCTELAASIGGPNADSFELVAEIAEAMMVPPLPEDARRVCNALIGRFSEKRGQPDPNHSSRVLVALAPAMDADLADTMVSDIVTRMLPSHLAKELDPMGAALAAIAPRLSAERRSHHCRVLAEFLVSEASENRVNAAGAAFNALAPLLPSEEAGALAGQVITKLRSSGRAPLHGLLAVAALLALDLGDGGMLEDLSGHVLHHWSKSPEFLEGGAALLGLERILKKADAEHQARIVRLLVEGILPANSTLRPHRNKVIGLIGKCAGDHSLVPHLEELLGFHIQAEDYDGKVFTMTTLLKVIRDEEIPDRDAVFSRLLAVVPNIQDVWMRELLIAEISPNAELSGEDAGARFAKEIANLIDPEYGRPPSAPGGLRIVGELPPVGLTGWDQRLERASRSAGSPTAAHRYYQPEDHSKLRAMVSSLDRATLDAGWRDLLTSMPQVKELRVACRMASALLMLAPPSEEEEADRIAGHLFLLIEMEKGGRYFYDTVPIFKGLIPHLGDAMLGRVTEFSLGVVSDGYPPECKTELREALIAAGCRQDAEMVIISLLVAMQGESREVLGEWLAPIIKELPTDSLANLLKAPFCVGPARVLCQEMLLGRLGQPASTEGRPPISPIEIIRLASEAGHDMESPWRRYD